MTKVKDLISSSTNASKVKNLIEKAKSLRSRVKGDLGAAVIGIEEQLKEISSIVGVKYEDVPNRDLILEASPIGSFDYIREKINAALNNMESFDPDGDGDNDKYCSYVVALFPDRFVIACMDNFFELTYSLDADGNVTLGDPVEVEQYFTATESMAFKSKGVRPSAMQKELQECGIKITKEAVDMDFDNGFITAHIKENSFKPDTGEVEIVIIEAGTNPLKKRHYPISTVKEAAPIFAGMKMYINHQTEKEEKERPERDLRDWVSTIQESNFSNGMAIGRVYIHDSWLRERMSDPVFAKNVGLSINTGGKISYGKINGEDMQIVEKINPTRTNGSGSVDWVTEAGARGRVLRSIKESASHKEGDDMKLTDVTLDQLQKENPDLFKKIQESASSGNDATKLAEANRVIEEMKKKDKLRSQKDVIQKLLKESKLPEVAKDRIAEELQESLFESEEKLKEAVTAKVQKELAYINSFSGKGKIKVGASSTVKENDVLQEAQTSLEDRFGLNTKEEDEEEKD